MESKPLRHIDFDDASYRLGGLGGSDSSIVLGIYPWKTARELWKEKLGALMLLEESPAIKRGKTLEGIVAQLYAEIKGRSVEIVKQRLVHPKFPEIYAHIDRKVTDPKMPKNMGPGVLEIKCPGMGIFTKCEREGLPEYYTVQLQHYLGVLGYKWGAFAVFSAEKWKLIEFDVMRNDTLIDLIFERDRQFWRYVQDREEPLEQVAQLESEMPEVAKGELVRMDRTNCAIEWSEAVREYQVADNLLKEADSLRDLAEEKLKQMMTQEGALIGEGAGARIYWKPQAGKKTLDKKAFAKGSPEGYKIYESYLNPGKPSRPFKPFFPKSILLE
jgi:putative phage-type endonuclease